MLVDHTLSDILRLATSQVSCPMGVAVLVTQETKLAAEVCEELWAARSPHINFYLSGVEVITNGSGSHHELRKLNSRIDLMKNATKKCGGVYMYSNHRGCDGGRLYFDGCALVCVNGELVTQASQFSLHDVEVVTATIDLEAIRSYRGATASLQEQASKTVSFPEIDIRSFSLRSSSSAKIYFESKPIQTRIHEVELECCKGPACWLWDYLRRSGASGYLLPLSGGADSAAVAAIVRVMAEMVAEAYLTGNETVRNDLERFVNLQAHQTVQPTASSLDSEEALSPMKGLSTSTEIANALTFQVLHTVYLGTANSSDGTRTRAQDLADTIRSYHSTLYFDSIISAFLTIFNQLTGRTPSFLTQGGTRVEDLALQNLQARIRMVFSYLLAQLFPWIRGKSNGFLLVLSAGNVDEALRGYILSLIHI